MILQHTFTEDGHVYKVDGQFVLSTSDIISLNGLSDMSAIPKANLDHASWRGHQLHLAIRYFEEDGEVPDMPEEVIPYFRGYCAFRSDYDFIPVGPLEKQIVYAHEGTEQAVGCTIDLRGLLKGQPYLLDAKSSHKQSGKAKKQKLLAWRMQTQSYSEATAVDRTFHDLLTPCIDYTVGRGIIHVNKEAGYEFHDFSAFDDSLLWDGAVRLAMAKLSNGFTLERR